MSSFHENIILKLPFKGKDDWKNENESFSEALSKQIAREQKD
jgi:hypothetical protein